MNNNITEDYCSFEVCKLLKEKGFDVQCRRLYDEGEPEIKIGFNRNSFNKRISCPTHSLAIKWIRLNFDIHIHVQQGKASEKYGYHIEGTKDACFETVYTRNSPEEATEAALLYTLQNLIL